MFLPSGNGGRDGGRSRMRNSEGKENNGVMGEFNEGRFGVIKVCLD